MSRLTKRENGELYYRQGENYAWSKPINKGNVKYPTLSKLAHYEDLEEQLEKLYDGKMPLGKVVENLNRIVQNGEEKLDYARILTNAEAEKWDKWKDLEEQGRLLELPCEKVYRIMNYDSPKYAFIDSIPIEMMLIYDLKHIDNGNIFFSTKEKAEAKLKGMEGAK